MARAVPERFLSQLFQALDRAGIPVTELLGDLPMGRADETKSIGPADWDNFAEFMRRLELHVGGESGLQQLGEAAGKSKPATTLRTLAGLTGSTSMLYRTVIRSALPSALPMIEASVVQRSRGQAAHLIMLRAKLHASLRPCPALFHLLTGAMRSLPGQLKLPNAAVEAVIDPTGRTAEFLVSLPPSSSFLAKARRIFRAIFSAGSALQALEQQQLELRAQHAALRREHDQLSKSEAQYRALTDAAADVLLEIDDTGRIAYVGASIEALVGYTREQITGSHFSLWIPQKYRDHARNRFAFMCCKPPGNIRFREFITLHDIDQRRVVGELSARSYITNEGSLRLACVLRDMTNRSISPKPQPPKQTTVSLTKPSPIATHAFFPTALAEEEEAFDRPMPISTPTSIQEDDSESRSMERIIDVAVAQSELDGAGPAAVETRKILEAVRLGAFHDVAMDNVELRFQTTGCPDEIFAEASLLQIALISLVDFIHASAPSASLIEISARQEKSPEGTPVIDFKIEARSLNDLDALRAEISAVGPKHQIAALAMAIARDAGNALSGSVLVEDPGSPRVLLRIPTL